ncbi:FtsH protease activity modulator HflK [Paraferrimonas sp. SM1919]|uniref:FtsH protease activity modulator HflK n=1 Tax=Paraferrimonas sp. SM1919 TaxID=2662263 RepID=UPI0013D6E005|nr:FtsH protease activity modulator HflK [Paraferrimonas sp. SM1919]
MAWNEPGNKGNDPWGNGGNGKNQGPPDIDEILKNVGQKFGGGNNVSGFGLIVGLVVALLIWVISGFYTINEAERGVRLTFGQYSGLVEPGLSWKMTFVEEIIPVNINNVYSKRAQGQMLTEDENVVDVEMEVQYKITDPRQYLFSATDANESLSEAMDSALRYVIGHTKMDDILTTGREKVRQDTRVELERIIEPYNLGLMISDINFLPARPPEQVKQAFDDAIAAQEDEERYVQEAQAYAREREPIARGQVKRMEQEANAYKERIILEAMGKVAKFEQLLPQYRAAPEVTRERLYIEAMAEVFGNTSKVLIDNNNSNNMMYLPLDKLINKANPSQSVASPRVNYPVQNSVADPVNPYSQSRESRTARQGRD